MGGVYASPNTPRNFELTHYPASVVSQKFLTESSMVKMQILRLTTPELCAKKRRSLPGDPMKNVRGPRSLRMTP